MPFVRATATPELLLPPTLAPVPMRILLLSLAAVLASFHPATAQRARSLPAGNPQERLALATRPEASPRRMRLACAPLMGQVFEANGRPLVGATLLVKGTHEVYVTDAEGRFQITNVVYQGQALTLGRGWLHQPGRAARRLRPAAPGAGQRPYGPHPPYRQARRPAHPPRWQERGHEITGGSPGLPQTQYSPKAGRSNPRASPVFGEYYCCHGSVSVAISYWPCSARAGPEPLGRVP